jgi:hypothetical protein
VDFLTWRGEIETKLLAVSGVTLMQELARMNEQELAAAVKKGVQIPKDFGEGVKRAKEASDEVKHVYHILKTSVEITDGTKQQELQKWLGVPKDVILSVREIARLTEAKISSWIQIERQLTKTYFKEARTTSKLALSGANVAFEGYQIKRELAESKNKTDAVVRVAPHVGSILKELPTTGELVKLARVAGSDTAEVARYGSKANMYLKVGEVALDLGFEAANINMTNEALRAEQADRRMLMYDASAARASFERKLDDNRRVMQLIREEGQSRLK